MNEKKRLIRTGLFLLALSVALHGLHFLIFKDLHHIMVYLLGDIAFIPLEVFLVTVVIDQLLEKKEKEKRMEKMHMLIGLYFQELGLNLLKVLVLADEKRTDFQGPCQVGMNWNSKDFRRLEQWLSKRKMEVNSTQIDYDYLYLMLREQKSLMVSLISNPTLIEHENFSELLIAVNHLQDEMALRERLKDRPDYQPDLKHWKSDLERVYALSAIQWIRYIEHLKENYPFLYNAARVTNPFEEASLLDTYEKIRGLEN
jgi:hypothetical protein